MKIGRSLVCGNIEGTLSERRLKDIDREVLNQNRQTILNVVFLWQQQATPGIVLHFSIEIKMKKAADLAELAVTLLCGLAFLHN